jgi:methionine-gamma-lyase
MPVYQAATFTFESPDEIGAAMLQPFHPQFYGRYATPNSIQAAAAIAELEGAEAGLVTSSGMAAISLALLTYLKTGDHIVAQRTLYPTTSKLITAFLPTMGIDVTVVDQVKNEEFEDAIKPNTKVIYIENARYMDYAVWCVVDCHY